jgi:hypothetical protein
VARRLIEGAFYRLRTDRGATYRLVGATLVGTGQGADVLTVEPDGALSRRGARTRRTTDDLELVLPETLLLRDGQR